MSLPIYVTGTRAISTSLSPEVDFGAGTVVGIHMPAAWTAAGMTFQVSPDGGATWNEMTSTGGAAVNFTVAAGQFINVDPALWRGVNAIKVRSGTSGSPVSQAAAAQIIFVTRVLA